MNLTEREQEIYELGIKAGIKAMEDKIEKHCKEGKPVMANGQLYFFKDAQENLWDIMNGMDK